MNATAGSFRHLRIAVILVLSVLVLGTAGYMLIEQLSFVDALYTTIAMMAKLGLLVKPLSEYGRIFTIAVTILGVSYASLSNATWSRIEVGVKESRYLDMSRME